MKKILWLMIVSICIGYVIDKRDERLKKKEKLFTIILTIFLIFFAGLRIWYNDTSTYIQIYNQTTTFAEFWQTEDAVFSNGVGFGLTNCVLKTIGFSVQDYLMFYSFISISLLMVFMRKYSVSTIFSVFLMFTTGYYIFTLAAIKQCVATAIALIALKYAIERRWYIYLGLIGLAVLFHPYAVVYLLVPFIMFKPWTIKTFSAVCIFVGIGFMLEQLLGLVLDVTVLIGASYSMDSFTAEGVNLFRVVVAFAPMIIAFLYGKNLFYNTTREENLIFNLAMLNALFMFVGLFGTANYFARLANYFLPAQIIVIPWIMQKATVRDKKWLIPCCVVGYNFYMYYEYGILRSFDANYDAISLLEYLSTLF